ncbi:ATP-grasp domain-containing protein [Planctomicrobium piriforme]|uniref:Ribosomal protein S6--L-glutamate ligase n=1 Tax=Planctomicrobium piriforme TaxID=1576369 RepID=A0A1I3GX52_9PLAN|nr:RimK family alpha-L-glutamate ligase [Planctomicrobium piriforme]SFI27971.1 ribosomal protein S6--L-glutamate ligase [Planctomicrobium piriforme]
MNIAVLGQADSWYVAELTRAAQGRGHAAECVDFRRLSAAVWEAQTLVTAGEAALHRVDAVLVRTMPPGSLEQVVFRMDALQRLEAQGIQVVNPPRAIEAAVDKFLTTARLAANGLPTPRTVVCESADDACIAFERLGQDVVVKPIFGSEGRGILRVSDPDLAYRTFRTLERTQAVLYLQEFIQHSGFDVRVLVLNGEVLGTFKRRHPTDFRTNVARAAVAEPHVATEEERQLALQACAAVGACFAGIDLLYDPAGRCLVIEVNAVPGWRAFQRVSGLDVADKVIEFLEKR